MDFGDSTWLGAQDRTHSPDQQQPGIQGRTKALRRSEQHFRSVAQTAGDAIVTADARGNILFWNEAAETIFQFRSAEVIGRSIEKIIPAGMRGKHRQRYARAMDADRPDFVRKRIEVVGRRKDNSSVPLELTLSRWTSRGEMFITAIIRDITRRKLAEQELLRAYELMEVRVRERTGGLIKALEKMRKEIRVRQEAQRALADSERRYRKLVKSTPVGIAVTNMAGDVLEFNPSLCEMFGITMAEARRHKATQFYSRRSDRRRLLSSLRHSRGVVRRELRVRRPDGRGLIARVHMSRVHLGGEPLLLTVVDDITPQKHAERRLQAMARLVEEAVRQDTAQHFIDAIVSRFAEWCECRCVSIALVQQGRVTYHASHGCSRRFLTQRKVPCLEATPCAFGRLCNQLPKIRGVPHNRLSPAFFCNHMSRFLNRESIRRNGVQHLPCFPAQAQSVMHLPIRFRGKIIGAVHLADPRSKRFPPEIIDLVKSAAPIIGEALRRYEVKEFLRESEERFRSLFEGHNVVMLLLEPGSGAIADANPAAERFYGFERAKLCRMRMQDLSITREKLPAKRPNYGRMHSGPVQSTHRLADGSVRTVQMELSPVKVGGQELLLAILHDITDRKRLEREILQISDQERGRIGRDLHDSLGGHLSGIALLTQGLTQALQAKALPEARVAKEIVKGIGDAVSQARSLARGLCPVGLGRLGLASGVQEYLGTLTRLYRTACRFEVRGDVTVADEATATHLYRIVQEAVTNAARHGKASEIRVLLSRRRHGLCLRVRDNGVGLPEEDRRNSGMGLRAMQHRAEIIGASLEIRSRPGKGTMISCCVPENGNGKNKVSSSKDEPRKVE